LEVIYVKNYEQLSDQSARLLYEFIKRDKPINVGLATGATPLGLYKKWIRLYRQAPFNLSQLTTFNLDEYMGVQPNSPNSYRYYMNYHVFRPLGISLEQTYLPNGMAEDIQAECKRYEELIRLHGGIDIQLLDVGRNGHIGFNEPGTSFSQETHEVKLSESTRRANEKYFHSLDKVPKKAITMGISTIIQAKKILLLASGEEKAEAIYHLVKGKKVTAQWPVTVLKNHPDVTLILDEDAAMKLNYNYFRSYNS
jgi:glucosamine-6-phosphate deaminase